VKSGDRIEISYQYDEKGRKSATERFNTQPVAPNTAYAGGWEGTELGFGPTSGGKATTLYNGQGVATGAQFYDAEGNLVGHIVRKFDAEGRIIAEEQASDAPQMLTLPEEIRSKLNPEQLKSVGALMAGAQNRSIFYSYDAQGRVIEQRISGGVLGEQVTVTTYNDHGDKASERETTTMSPEAGSLNLHHHPRPPKHNTPISTINMAIGPNRPLSADLSWTKRFAPARLFAGS
jgi:hypothetical protein